MSWAVAEPAPFFREELPGEFRKARVLSRTDADERGPRGSHEGAKLSQHLVTATP
jgi:hypothetical protein